MYRDGTKSPKSQNVRNRGSTTKADAERFTRVKEIMNKKVGSPLMKEIVAHADISSILKEHSDALQDDVGEDSFNPPFHSTAVYADDDELVQNNENPDQIPAKKISSLPPVLQEKSVKPNHRKSKSKPAASTEHSAHRPDTSKSKKTPKKKALHVPEPGSSKKNDTVGHLADGAQPSSKAQNTTTNRKVSAEKEKTQREEHNTSSKKKSRKDKMETAPAESLSPEKVSKSVKNINELDVIHFECGKLIDYYRERVETDVCKTAIDIFCRSFKEQLSTTISDVRKLKDLKKQNTKMLSEIGRKRKRLLEIKNEIITKQPRLTQLQKECSELQEKQEALKSTSTFLDNLALLQNNYMKFKAKNPHIKETYGTSSLPALCLETENIMKAEQHFHTVNRQLQSFIDQEEGDS